MSLDSIVSSLEEIFNSPLKEGENRKIVYWQDIDGAFQEEFNSIQMDNVKKHVLYENNYFKTKYLLEVEDRESNYLIYTQEPLEANNNNWLLDNILYSTLFYADEASIYCRELGIPEELKRVVKNNIKFFRNKNRRGKFLSYNISDFSEEIIHMAIISVLTNQRTVSFEDSLRTILMAGLIDKNNKYLKEIETFFDIDTFWYYVEKNYGYKEGRYLKELFIHLLVTSISTYIPKEKLERLKKYVSDKDKGNCAVFIDRWMNHKIDYELYNRYAKEIEDEIGIYQLLQVLDIKDIENLDIFPSIDKAIILYIVKGLEDRIEDFEDYIRLIDIRKTKHFYEGYKHIYQGLYYTIKMFQFKKQYPSIPIELPNNMIKSYAKEYYLMDLYYRKFYCAFDKDSTSQILQKLKAMVEGLYTNWFMVELSHNWSQSISEYVGDIWDIPGTVKQVDFYDKYIASLVGENRKVFIIISDALRYDIGAELCKRLDWENLGSVELQTLVAGLPTTTKFGMARLLPHGEIKLKENGYVYVDNINSGNMEGRKQILSKYSSKSTAMDYKDYMAMPTAKISDFYKGKYLNYIYHNTIDAIGDSALTEIKAFEGCEAAIDELAKLVRSIINYAYGSTIYITSDHGFIYQREELEEVDKIAKEDISAIEEGRRYLLSEEIRDIDGLLRFSMKDTLGSSSKLNVYIPRANIRFKRKGAGANFVHGGASLQEVLVPLIIYRDKKSGQIGAVESEKASIKLISATRRITNSIFALDFFQTERVGGKITPSLVKVYLMDSDENIISNEGILLADKSSDKPEDRTMTIRFILKSMDYDRNKDYYLIIEDVETGEYERIPFTIDL
ncbi:MAG: BREX-1 system phosphatase PglZ type A [Tissierellia bacterium]|nr:BREX-1 system phosphatase PglZ type A [Tissierellia bacterium]